MLVLWAFVVSVQTSQLGQKAVDLGENLGGWGRYSQTGSRQQHANRKAFLQAFWNSPQHSTACTHIAMDTFPTLRNLMSANKANSPRDYIRSFQNIHTRPTVTTNNICQMVYLQIGNPLTTYGWRNAQFHLPINWFLITCIKFNFK